ncbi:HlyD family secretion protein [Acetonema longum]|uniref:Membrane-fusion protein n=1 Tax=Acetonema longum DSM 6540 TaxID=1009370 RepID=F7NP11_9FIRM|nr:efflux RND transporter periplasmic adaptor subunit [Acetonema longum]EGO62134.1 membrane-fusion protein [Acetonema longum DSM 6540]
MKRKLIALAVILALLGAGAAYKLTGRKIDGIAASGTIEITQSDIAPKVAGYLEEFTIREGDTVQAGQVLAKVSRTDLTAQLLRDEAALAKAQAQLRDLESGAREQEVTEARAMLASARSVYDKSKNDWERFQKLYQDGAVSAQQRDNARSAYEVAYHSLAAAQSRLQLVEEGSRPETIAAQRKEVERSRAVVDASKSTLADTILISPVRGLVLSRNYEQGEFVNVGAPVATVGDMTDCWVKIYIPSGQMGQIGLGQPARIRVDSFPDKVFAGQVKEISQTAEFNPRQSLTQRERANMVFAVKVRVDNGELLLKPGMPADVVLP